MKEGSICNKCNHRAYCDMSDEHNNDNATIKGCYLYSEQKAMTNADRIRSMSDEEFSKWIAYVAHIECNPYLYNNCPHIDDLVSCDGCWLEWLKEECES